MSTSWLCTIASPTSFPPVTRPATAPGILFFSSTLETILVTAIEHSGVVGEGFQMVALPAAIEMDRFLGGLLHAYTVRSSAKRLNYQPYTATGKLNADTTPSTPSGFGTTIPRADEQRAKNCESSPLTFEYSMAWPFRVDHSSVEHPREPHCIIALRSLIKIKTRSISTGETYDIDEFLDLAYALRSDLAHLEGHECAELIAL